MVQKQGRRARVDSKRLSHGRAQARPHHWHHGAGRSYLAELLLARTTNTRRDPAIVELQHGAHDHLYRPADPETRLFLHYVDLGDASSLSNLLAKIRPDEIYNLPRRAMCAWSFDIPEYTGDITGLGTVRILEAIRDLGIKPRFYQASSSELYGKVRRDAAEGVHAVHPRSPYAARQGVRVLHHAELPRVLRHVRRDGILFNHDTPARGETVVTRKITRALVASRGLQDKLYLGNLDAKRDWGFAGDYVEAMWACCRSISRTLRDRDRGCVQRARVPRGRSECAGLRIADRVVVDPKYFRPAEVDLLLGDASKRAASSAGSPRSTSRHW